LIIDTGSTVRIQNMMIDIFRQRLRKYLFAAG